MARTQGTQFSQGDDDDDDGDDVDGVGVLQYLFVIRLILMKITQNKPSLEQDGDIENGDKIDFCMSRLCSRC